MNEFEKTKLALRYWLLGKEYFTAVKAMEYATTKHTGYRKDNKTPEFHHQICIASYIRTLPSVLNLEATLATAFLHDVIEDYNVSIKAIEEFGNEVAQAALLLTKTEFNNNESYYYNISQNAIASVVKGADRMHNIQTMNGVFGEEKKKDYLHESNNFVLPMLKTARRKFPEQEAAYENIKLVLNNQIELINYSLENNGLG